MIQCEVLQEECLHIKEVQCISYIVHELLMDKLMKTEMLQYQTLKG